MSAQLWEVVGGGDKGGVIVRDGRDLKSNQLEQRLSTGALVRELALEGDRLQYECVSGTGPPTGWISTRLKDKELAVRKDEALVPQVPADSQAAESPPERIVVGPGSGCRHRWAVNIDDWNPTGEDAGPEFEFLLGLIKEEPDRAQVKRFKFYADKKRALMSRLLMRQSSASALGLTSFKALSIKRTKGRKPFLAAPLTPEDEAPNFNVNVSHEGSWVVCASEPLCVVGVDVAELRRLKPNGEAIDFYKVFKENLTDREWADVRAGGPTLDDQYEVFSRYWSAKEAFVKARGDGIAYPLGQAEFKWSPLEGFAVKSAYEGTVVVEGRPAPLWRFVQHRMPGERAHWTTISRGPLTDIVDAHGEFTATLRQKQNAISETDWRIWLQAESHPFDVISVSALVPEEERAAYVAAGGGAIRS